VNGPVICGIDHSSVAAGAVEVARELAQRYDVPLVYAHVLDRDGDEQKAERRLQIAVAADAEVVIEAGHAADRLVALAQERKASFLVVGNHGPRSSLLGSISADVSRRAPCPVVVVAPTAEISGQRRSGSGTQADGGIFRFSTGYPNRRVA
jgi:nucleotide-binding universal stress UspA family protein